MASRFVRSTRQVQDINNYPTHISEENDLISTINGEVYIKTINGYEKITGIKNIQSENDGLKKEIKNLKSENTKIKNKNNSLEERIEKLESDSNNESGE